MFVYFARVHDMLYEHAETTTMNSFNQTEMIEERIAKLEANEQSYTLRSKDEETVLAMLIRDVADSGTARQLKRALHVFHWMTLLSDGSLRVRVRGLLAIRITKRDMADIACFSDVRVFDGCEVDAEGKYVFC